MEWNGKYSEDTSKTSNADSHDDMVVYDMCETKLGRELPKTVRQ